MNWIEGISEALRYIDENLTGELNIDDIAAKACSSPAYFQKSFSLLCGFTVGEYIRNRRLASAGKDLLTTDENVIDIALKYGYDSADSFTKAFVRFHGATPSDVRKRGHQIKSYAPLKLELFMKGGYVMDYRIVKNKGFKVKVRIDAEKGKIEYLDDGNLPDYIWLSLDLYYGDKMPGKKLPIEKAGSDVTENDFEQVNIPDYMWAVFKCSGDSKTVAVNNTCNKIMNEWLPQTNYEKLSSNFIQIYKEGDNTNFGEIRIAVREKKQ